MRPCFRIGNIIAGRGFCPIHDFWPAVRRATSIGPPPLFFGIKRGNINRILKASMSAINAVGAHQYSLRGFRRGCIMEIKRSGSTLWDIIGSGGRAAAGYKAYLSFHEGEEAVLKALLREINHGSGSEDDYSSPDGEFNLDGKSPAVENDEIRFCHRCLLRRVFLDKLIFTYFLLRRFFGY